MPFRPSCVAVAASAAIVFFAAALAGAAGPSPFGTAMSWANKHGSVLTVAAVDADGLFRGTYVNRDPGFSCQGTEYPVTGWATGTAVTFSVLWRNVAKDCESATSWTGFYYNGRITASWSLVPDGAINPDQIQKGEDIFSPAEGGKEQGAL
jgi:hypothetical protein